MKVFNKFLSTRPQKSKVIDFSKKWIDRDNKISPAVHLVDHFNNYTK